MPNENYSYQLLVLGCSWFSRQQDITKQVNSYANQEVLKSKTQSNFDRVFQKCKERKTEGDVFSGWTRGTTIKNSSYEILSFPEVQEWKRKRQKEPSVKQEFLTFEIQRSNVKFVLKSKEGYSKLNQN